MQHEMSLAAVRVFVSDIAGATQFYEQSIGLRPTVSAFDDGFAIFTLANGVDLILEEDMPDDEEDENLVGRFVGVSIAVAEIDRVYDDLTDKGVRFVEAPERQPWGGILAHFLDPDDNILTLVQLPNG